MACFKPLKAVLLAIAGFTFCGSAFAVTVSGSVKVYYSDYNFAFSASDAQELGVACEFWANSNGVYYSTDIFVRVNNGAMESATAGGTLYGAGAICGQIVQTAGERGAFERGQSRARGQVSVRGLIEEDSYTFDGFSRKEIFEKCKSFYKDNYVSSWVDDITVTINDVPVKPDLRNYGGYWKTDAQVCTQIVDKISQEDFLTDGGDGMVPSGCGNYALGALWYQDAGWEEYEVKCPAGGRFVEIYDVSEEYVCQMGFAGPEAKLTGDVEYSREPVQTEGHCNVKGSSDRPEVASNKPPLSVTLYRPYCNKTRQVDFKNKGYEYKGIDAQTGTQIFEQVVHVTEAIAACSKDGFFNGGRLTEREDYKVRIRFRAIDAKITSDNKYVLSGKIDKNSFVCEKTSGDGRNRGFDESIPGNCDFQKELQDRLIEGTPYDRIGRRHPGMGGDRGKRRPRN